MSLGHMKVFNEDGDVAGSEIAISPTECRERGMFALHTTDAARHWTMVGSVVPTKIPPGGAYVATLPLP